MENPHSCLFPLQPSSKALASGAIERTEWESFIFAVQKTAETLTENGASRAYGARTEEIGQACGHCWPATFFKE
ncbi:hypothetical protein KCU83_g285, partial [Aureobasidium melanogenum]